jgi:hypothetical protein
MGLQDGYRCVSERLYAEFEENRMRKIRGGTHAKGTFGVGDFLGTFPVKVTQGTRAKGTFGWRNGGSHPRYPCQRYLWVA